MNQVYEKLMNAYRCFKEQIDFSPKIGLVLGSGLGSFAQEVDVKAVLPYSQIDGFPVSTAPGHAGRFVFGFIKDVPVVLMQGRIHYYEGYDITDVVLPERLMKLMGAEVLFLTNAAGGFGDGFTPGTLMMITDHISCFAPNPLVGQNIEELGPRFPDMSDVYDKELQQVIRQVAVREGIDLREGVYAQLTGPSFETPAEIHMLKSLGASACGMSTVVEAIAANHMGMKICGISCITNMAAGFSDRKQTQEEVMETADRVEKVFCRLVRESILAIGRQILAS
jgi:purine-nucleoside phosphorylase